MRRGSMKTTAGDLVSLWSQVGERKDRPPCKASPLALKAPDGPGLLNGTAAHTLTRRHAGTLSYHKVKIKGLGRGERKKDFPVFAAGSPNTLVGACALGRGRLALEESSKRAGGYRVGTSRDMYKEGRCPHSAPDRAELAQGGRLHIGEQPHWECPHPTLAEGKGLGVMPCRPLHTERGGCYVHRRGAWNVGDRSSCHPTSPSLGLKGSGHQGTWLPGESGSAKSTCASGSVGVG